MTAALQGLWYFLAVFTFAFGMGVARTLLIAPRLGQTAAVLLEIPVVLVVSWIAARLLLRHRRFTLSQRAIMGITGFGLTMLSEAALSSVLRGQSVVQWAETLATPLGMIGLAGQIGFAAIPPFVGCGRNANPRIV